VQLIDLPIDWCIIAGDGWISHFYGWKSPGGIAFGPEKLGDFDPSQALDYDVPSREELEQQQIQLLEALGVGRCVDSSSFSREENSKGLEFRFKVEKVF